MSRFNPLKWSKVTKFIFAFAFALIAVAGVARIKSPDPAGFANPDDVNQVAVGHKVYIENCAVCHGRKLEGQPDWRIRKDDGRLPAPPHDKTGHTWHHPDAQLFQMTKNGLKPPLAPEGYESDMPAFKYNLSDDEIWAVISFIKSTWPNRIKSRQQQRSINK